ncbi:MAG: hypothetical protein ABUT20_02555 [Bacteroidota bacterium]
MKIQKLICLVLLVTGLSIHGFAQKPAPETNKPYQSAIGVRISNSYYDFFSGTYKFFISEAGAIDIDAGFGVRSYYDGYVNGSVKPFTFAISAAYQHHFEIPVKNGGLFWFIGGGLTGYRVFSSYGNFDGFGFGVFPTGGVEYKIPNIPLAVSADYRPTIFLTAPDHYDSFYGGNVGVTARFTIGEK